VARRLIIDTGVLIHSERGNHSLRDIIKDGDDLVVAAITVAELRTGVELAGDRHRAGRIEFLLRILENLPVEPYDHMTAEAHGRLLAHVHRTGRKRGAHDLIIAATAVATRRIVLTGARNAHFAELPDVECLEIPS
jgi:tRNA(fMet)-specific endonuclease VapC